MKKYIFYTTQEHIVAPNDDETKYCQVLGIVDGENIAHAKDIDNGKTRG